MLRIEEEKIERTTGPRTTGPRGPTVRGPVVRGPTVRRPIVRGPICLEPLLFIIYILYMITCHLMIPCMELHRDIQNIQFCALYLEIFRDFASRFYLILQFAAALDIFSNLMLHLVLMYLEWEGLKIIFQSFLYTSTQKAFALVKYQWKACVLPLEYFVPVLDGPSNRICLQS